MFHACIWDNTTGSFVDIYSYGIAYIHIHNTVNVAETEIFPRHIFEAFRYLPDFFLQF